MPRFTLSFLISLFTITSVFAQDQTFEFDSKNTLTLAFGSCNRQNLEQPLWQPIIEHSPDLFMFLGDNIYGDTDDMTVLREKYELQKNQIDYKTLREQVPIIGVWDDHDYGKNDAGQEYEFKKESQQLFLDFFDVSQDDPRREREGAYSSYNLKWKSHTIKVILLDARYHRDHLDRVNRVYQKNEKGTILGEAQWAWLEKELSDPTVSLYIIASGIQFIPEDHDYEKWANFPKERQKLIDLIQKKQPKGALLLSGDRHISEISSLQVEDLDYPLIDVTSSGLTHVWENAPQEPNQHRIGKLVNKLNYGLVKIEESESGLRVISEIRGENQDLLQVFGIVY
ncbi:alkaline phosphatase D family protein [Marivirga harenae]|uniref:alkaline phosphatase D family protein n=1 Tax=Marivirga harenae TaxID=2010992 RepID=UPI0026DF8A47|nr:alkaline phosphatase D family protein [Marivirga harenae]WKV12495.1 alkaline phosphatase D family protein [Marivirga harenae]